MSAETTATGCIGIVILFLGFFVLMPMYLFLVFAVLSAADVPAHVWAVFWTYVGLRLVFGGIGLALEVAKEMDG